MAAWINFMRTIRARARSFEDESEILVDTTHPYVAQEMTSTPYIVLKANEVAAPLLAGCVVPRRLAATKARNDRFEET